MRVMHVHVIQAKRDYFRTLYSISTFIQIIAICLFHRIMHLPAYINRMLMIALESISQSFIGDNDSSCSY